MNAADDDIPRTYLCDCAMPMVGLIVVASLICARLQQRRDIINNDYPDNSHSLLSNVEVG
jgi:hypothetical protein